MPFLELNFSTNDSSAVFRENLVNTVGSTAETKCYHSRNKSGPPSSKDIHRLQLKRLLWPTYLTNSLFNLNPSSWSAYKWWRKTLYVVHATLLAILAFCTIATMALQATYLCLKMRVTTSFNSYALFVLEVQGKFPRIYNVLVPGLGNMIVLFIWHYVGYQETFLKRLCASAAGIGIIKRHKTVEKIFLILYNFIRTGVIAFYLVSHTVPLNVNMATDFVDTIPRPAGIVYSVVILLCCIAHLNCSSVFLIYYFTICAEYWNLGEELKEDVNSFQLPVATHYVHAHVSAWKLWRIISSIMGYWQNMTTSVSSVAFWFLVAAPDYRSASWFDISIASFLILDALITISFHFAAGIFFRRNFDVLYNEFLNLISSGRILQEAVYPFLNTYALLVSRSKFRARYLRTVELTVKNMMWFITILTILGLGARHIVKTYVFN